MIYRSRKALFSLLVAVVSAAAVPSAAGAVTVGISDQTSAMFGDSHFKSLKIHQARITVSWNVMQPGHERERAGIATWLAAAARAGVSPLVSIGADVLNGNNVPGVGTYSYWVQKFIQAFPSVKTYSAWNEPDWPFRHAVARHPDVAAGYFNQLYVHCPGCTVVAGDFSDQPASKLRPFLRSYLKYLRHKPAAWAVHDYIDVRTHTTGVLRMMIQMTRGPIWLDEISGVERRGHWPYPNQNATAAGLDEAFLFSLPTNFPRLARIYHYQWRDDPAAHWDSGLLGPNGELRAAYRVIAKATGGHRPDRPARH
jgi:hypothetical protein